MCTILDDGFNEVEPDWPAKKPARGKKPSSGQKELILRKKLGPDGWRKYLRQLRNKSRESLEGPKDVPLEYRGERPTFNFPIYISSRTKDSYRDRYEQRQSPRPDDLFDDDT